MWLAIEGDLRFLSHRDSARLLERAAARAELPIAYTQGFNPHPVLRLVCPRPVGVASRDDLMVVALVGPVEPDRLVERMNRQVPAGMRFLRAASLEGRHVSVPRRIGCECPVPPAKAEHLRRSVEQFRRGGSWPIERSRPARRRGGTGRTVAIDLQRLVEDLRLDGGMLRWALVGDGQIWARPGEVLDALGLDGRVDLAATVRAWIDYGL